MAASVQLRKFLLVPLWLVCWHAATGQVVTPESQPSNILLPATNMPPLEVEVSSIPVDEEMMDAMGYFNASSVFRLFYSVLQDARSRDRYRLSRPRQQELDIIVKRLEASFPMSFEYHYAQWLNHPFDTANAFHLHEAYRLAPEPSILLDDKVAHYELINDLEKKSLYCKLIYQSRLYDSAIYHYAHNLLRSVQPGAFLVTRGEWDTHPVWVLQHIFGQKTDVTILQMDLLHQEHYFNRVMEPFALRRGAYRRFLHNKPAFFRELAEASSHKQPVYLSLTLDREFLENTADLLYNTGLAMRLSVEPFQNLAILAENWQSFSIQHLEQIPSDPEIAGMMGNYIFPMALLYQQAVSKGQEKDALEFRRLMHTVAQQAGLTSELEQYLQQ